MAKLAPVLFILAAVIAAAVVLFGGGESDGPSLDTTDDWDEEQAKPPELRTSDDAGSGRRKKSGDTKVEPTPAQAPPRGRVDFLKGVVVDDTTGGAIRGAVLHAEYAEPTCPRLPEALTAGARLGAHGPPAGRLPAMGQWGGHHGAAAPYGSLATGADGRFVWRVGDARALAHRVDVFVRAAGYIGGVVCQPEMGSDITVRLKKAIRLDVEVTDRAGRPIGGARLMVRPAPETPALPVHAGMGATDANGRGTIDGLAPGTADGKGLVVLAVDHPAWMPLVSAPFDPAREARKHIRLEPALLLSLKLRSDDGSAIGNPSLGWQTDGTPPHSDLQLLVVSPNGPEGEPNAEVLSEAVRIPCHHAHVHLEVKADGFTAWAQKEPLPAAGGTREIIVILTRDTSLGTLELTFQNAAGEAVPYAKLGSAPLEVTALGEQDPGAMTMEAGATLVFKSLPAGPYLITKRSASYAPASIEVEVRAGDANKATVKLKPPAKLRVRFLSDGRHMVEFRLVRNRMIMPAFPTSEVRDVVSGASPAAGPRPLSARGGEGALFTGLPGGTVTIEVTSPNLVAAPHAVELKEGETSEVEIEVRER